MTSGIDQAGKLLDDISSGGMPLSKQVATIVATPSFQRKRRKRQEKWAPKATLKFQNDVAVLRAEGLTVEKTAKLLDVSKPTVIRVANLPEVKAHIQALRTQWEDIAHSKITEFGQHAWEMAKANVTEGDSKAFDQTMRGLSNMERISASVAGVERKIEVSGMPPAVDARQVIMQLFGDGQLTK